MNLSYQDILQEWLINLYHYKDLENTLHKISQDITGFYQHRFQYDDFKKLFQNICYSYNDYQIIDCQLSSMNDSLIQGSYMIEINHFQQIRFYLTVHFSHQQINYLHMSEEINIEQQKIEKIIKESHFLGIYSYYLDDFHTCLFINETYIQMLGYTKEDFQQNHQMLLDIDESDRKRVHKQVLDLLKSNDHYRIEYRMVKKDKSFIWILEQGKRSTYQGKDIINCVVSDITSLKNTELDLKVQKQKYSLALKDNSISILEYDIKKDCVVIDILDESKKKIYDHYLSYVASSRSTVFQEDKHLVIELFQMKRKGPIEFREHLRGTNQYVRKLMESTIIYDQYHHPAIVLATTRDITTEWNHKFQLERKVQSDPLTHLFNLESGKEKINNYLQDIPQNYALMVLDIDYFKTVNDNFGHLFGNQVLIKFSKCLQDIIESPHLLIRIGGDEFMILLKDCSFQQINDIARTICQNVRKLDFKQKLSITASIGVCYVDHQFPYTFEQLFKQADQALYKVKNSGRNHYVLVHINDKIEQNEKIDDLNKVLQTALSHHESFEHLLGYIGFYYHMNRISLLSINKPLVEQHHLWYSSRSYQVKDETIIINDCDFQQINKNDVFIYQNGDECPLSHQLLTFLKQGVAQTIILLKIDSSHFLSCVSYNNHQTYQDELYKHIMFIYNNSHHSN